MKRLRKTCWVCMAALACVTHASATTVLTFGNGDASLDLLPGTAGQSVDLFLSASPNQLTSGANLQLSVATGGPAVSLGSTLSETIYAGGFLLTDADPSDQVLNVGLLGPLTPTPIINASGTQKLGTLTFDTTGINSGTYALDFSATLISDQFGSPINFNLVGGASVVIPSQPIPDGTLIGIDFGGSSATNGVGNDWNESNGTTAIPAGSVINLDGNVVDNVAITFSGAQFNNNDGSNANYASALPGTPGIDPHFVESVITDIAGVFSAGSNPYEVTISGLDDAQTYNITAVSAADFAANGTEDLTINGGATSSVARGTSSSPTFHRFDSVSSVNGELVLAFSQNGGSGFNPIVNGILLEVNAAAVPADLDGDGDVDDADFGLAFAAFTGPNNGPSNNPDADLDGDGDVDDADFGIAFAAFTGPGGAQVPEPGSLLLLAVGGLAFMRRRSDS